MSQATIYISYGLGGGLLNSRKFRKLVKDSGFRITNDEKADILVAHSAGCWLAAKDLKPRLVIYSGMPMNEKYPKKIWWQANISSLRRGNFWRSFKTKIIGAYYLLLQPSRNWNIVSTFKVEQPTIYKDADVIFISNHYDPWPKSENLKDFMNEHEGWCFLSLPGSHDTIWEEPELFTEVIKVYADRLLA